MHIWGYFLSFFFFYLCLCQPVKKKVLLALFEPPICWFIHVVAPHISKDDIFFSFLLTLWWSMIRYLYFPMTVLLGEALNQPPVHTDVNCALCQSDKNQSGALAHIWFQPWVDFITLWSPWQRSPWSFHILGGLKVAKVRWRSGSSKQVKHLVRGLAALWGRWRKSSLANVSLSGSLNHLQDTHLHMLSNTGMHTHIAFTLLLLANMGWYKDPTQWAPR